MHRKEAKECSKRSSKDDENEREREIPCLSIYKYVTRDSNTGRGKRIQVSQRWLLEFGHWKIHIFTSCWFQWWIPCNICMSLKRAFCTTLDAKRWFPIPKLVPRLFNRTVEYTRAHFLFHMRSRNVSFIP